MSKYSAKNVFSHTVIKPVVAGGCAGLLDHLVMKNTDVKSNLMFGGAVGAGVFGASVVGAAVGPMMSTRTPLGVLKKTLEMRMIEITAGSAGAYVLNTYVLKNEFNQANFIKKVGLIAVSDFVGEAVCDFFLLV